MFGLKSGRLLELDGLRAFAILPVLLLHFAPTSGPLKWLGPFCASGWMGVDLFFVMSGYLITGILLDSVGKPHYYRNFLVRRAFRILPLYYICLAIFTAAIYLSPNPAEWRNFAAWGGTSWFVFYAGNIRMVMQNKLPPNPSFVPLWSLQVEEQYYLLYPMLVAACSRITLRKVLVGGIVAAPVIRCLTVALLPESHYLPPYILTPCRMDALALGGLLALLLREGGLLVSNRQLQGIVLLSASVTAAILLFRGADPTGRWMRTVGYSVIDFGCAAILALVVTSPRSRIVGHLRHPVLVYIGKIAYGLYLMHTPVAWATRMALSPFIRLEPHDSASLVASLIATFVVAAGSWQFFESKLLAQKERYTA